MREIKISSKTGGLTATTYDTPNAEAVLVIASATGVKQSYYRKFAQFISSEGISVITFDYRGIDKSLHEPITELSHNCADWGRYDLESILKYVLEHYPDSRKYILGHSIGGQLIGLAESSTQFDKIILVAAQSGYWRLWSGMGRLKMWTYWHILFPFLFNTFGYLASKRISGMENLPKNVVAQWTSWGKNPDYILSEFTKEQTVYGAISTDITAVSIEDDELAPKTAVEWMTSQFDNAQVKSLHLQPTDFNTKQIGHFGIFKERFQESIWRLLLKELA